MTFLYIADQLADEQRWREERRPRITATDVARIMCGGTGAWARVKRDKTHGSAFRGNRYTDWGHEREPFIVDFLQRRHGLYPNSWLLARADDPRAAATPDAISLDGLTLGEVKTTVHDWPTVADIPRDYWWQMQWQMYVTGAARTVFAFELHEDFMPVWPQPRTFTVDRDDDAISEALERVAEWEAYEPDEVPEQLLVLDEWMDDLALIREDIAVKQAQAAEIESRMTALLEEHGKPVTFKGSRGSLSWSYPRPAKRFQQAAFKEAHPDLYAEFHRASEESPAPRLTVKTKD